MSDIAILEAAPSDAEELSKIAFEVWRECYVGVVPEDQTEYMLAKFQSPAAIAKQMTEENYRYFFLTYCGEKAGYASICDHGDYLFLSKLYVLSTFRKKGIASFAVEEIAKIKKPVQLTVNRGNERAINAYYRMGFTKLREQKVDIGEGFVMDDFVMQLS